VQNLSRPIASNRNGNRSIFESSLHDPMAATLANGHKSILLKDPANLGPRKDSKLTQREPRSG